MSALDTFGSVLDTNILIYQESLFFIDTCSIVQIKKSQKLIRSSEHSVFNENATPRQTEQNQHSGIFFFVKLCVCVCIPFFPQ